MNMSGYFRKQESVKNYKNNTVQCFIKINIFKDLEDINDPSW